MATLNNVISGLKNYLESELIPQISGLNKWIVGAGIAMSLDKGTEIFNQIKTIPLIHTLEIVDQEDNINIDKLYKYLLEQAKKSAVTFSAPIVGAMTFKSSDIEKLYNFIKESEQK